MPEPFLHQARLTGCGGSLYSEAVAQALGRGVGTYDAGGAHRCLDVLVGLGAAPTPQPRCLVSPGNPPALAANPVHKFERVHELGGDWYAPVTNRLALLEGSECEGLALQIDVPGGRIERF